MPHLIWSPQAQRDLLRLYDFLAPGSHLASRRALQAIREGTLLLEAHPHAGQPVPDRSGMRDWRIPFGASGYVVRYHRSGENIVIIGVRHMREVGF